MPHAAAIESDQHCRSVLCGEHPCRPQHLFGEMNDFWKPSVMASIQSEVAERWQVESPAAIAVGAQQTSSFYIVVLLHLPVRVYIPYDIDSQCRTPMRTLEFYR
jgi:hypothetical protein